jgi:drug/metabolite transporter (DMT)-like permease
VEVVFGLSAASVFGVADYLGGRASRSVHAIVVTFLGQSAALVVLLAIALGSRVPVPGPHDWLWGGLAGICGATGLLAFYRAMGSGFMTVAAPISAVTTGGVPIVIGLARGERPEMLALIGMPIALIAVALVSDVFGPGHRRAPRSVVYLSLLAGLVFGSLFVMLDRTSTTSGVWPIVAMRVASVPFMAMVVLSTRKKLSTARFYLPMVILSGVLDSIANALFLLATREGYMSVVAVIVSLYPASTLILATRIDKEKIHRPQAFGLGLAALSLIMISIA